MKTILKIILFFAILTNSNEFSCSDKAININSLGTRCKNIDDILENEDLKIDLENLLYLAINNGGLIEKNNYILQIYKLNDEKLQSQNIKKSKLFIPEKCMKAMENDDKIKLDRTKGIVILTYNYNKMNRNNIPEIFFVIRQDNENSEINLMNSKYFDFSLCHEDPILFDHQIDISNLKYDLNDTSPIDIDKIMYAKLLKIDLFDIHSDFLNDICFSFTSEVNTDVTLDARLENYYQNITLCNESLNAHYMQFNYSKENRMLTYRCAYGFYENEQQKESSIDDIDKKVKKIFSNSNIKVIKCYNNLSSIKEDMYNYGLMICFGVLLAQIILYIDFCTRGNKPLKKQLMHMFDKAETKRKSMGIELNKEKDSTKNKEGANIDDRVQTDKNINPDLNDTNIENISEVQREKQQEVANVNEKKESEKSNKQSIANPNSKKGNSRNDNEMNGKVAIADSSTLKKMPPNSEISRIKEEKIKNFNPYNYNDEEMNDFSYEKAIKYDKRSFCRYYWFTIQFGHIIINVFCRPKDYNLFSIKFGLLLMLFPINLTFNIFFFTNNNIKSFYLKKIQSISTAWEIWGPSILASCFATILLIFLKFLCLTHQSFMNLRKIKDINKGREKSIWVFKCIKFRIFLYYLFSYIFLILFGYYVGCFCSVFKNTQINIIKSMFASWVLSLVYPFIIYFIAAIFRILALRCKCKCFYSIAKLLQLF